jgi:hypothetical protein
MAAKEPVIPSKSVVEEMRRHLEEEHGRDFAVGRDVSYQGNAAPDALITHRPESAATAEGFWCSLCPGKVFLSALQPELSEERIAYLAHRDPGLAKLLAEAGEDEHAELVEARAEEQSAKAILDRRRRRARLSTQKPQPVAQERRERAQAYLLVAYEKIGNVEEALWELAQLRTRDPKAFRRVMGDEHDYKIETLRKYWQAIPIEERQAAKQRYIARQEPG